MICFNAEDAESDVRAFRGVKHFIQTSTVSTFGCPLPALPTNEDTPLKPDTDYGVNKVAADNIFLAAHARGDMPVTVLKPIFIYGLTFYIARQLGGDKRWIDRLRRGMPLLVSGDVVITHLHADDAGIPYAAAIDRAACFGQTYIVASPRHSTWHTYHRELADALGYSAPLVEAPADFLIKAWPDNTRTLAVSHRWHQVMDVRKLQRDIPEFQPARWITDDIKERLAWAEENGQIVDARSDDTEDRLIAAVDRLWGSFNVSRA